MAKFFAGWHPVTWAATSLVFGLMLLLNVPGEQYSFYFEPNDTWEDQQAVELVDLAARDYRAQELWQSPHVFEHGWPRACLVRTVPGPFQLMQANPPTRPLIVVAQSPVVCSSTPQLYYLSWSCFDNWPVVSTHMRVNWLNLAVDGLLAVISIVATGWATQRWIRSRRTLLRFRIIDLLSASTLVAVTLGWYMSHARLAELEQNFASRVGVTKEYSGPAWLKKLVGTTWLLPAFQHIDAVHFSEEYEATSLATLPRLAYLRHVDFRAPVSPDALQVLRDCNHLNSLSIRLDNYSQAQLTFDPVTKRMRQSPDALGPGNLRVLKELRIDELVLGGWPFVAEDVEAALAANSIDRVKLDSVSITWDQFNLLQSCHPDVDFERTHGPANNDDGREHVQDVRTLRGYPAEFGP